MPEFTQADIDRKIAEFQREKVRKIFETLSYIGINCVKYAKNNGSYTDRTGNLRSSIGYAVITDGAIQQQQIEGTTEGQAQAGVLMTELAAKFTQGMVLVVVAGMEYAAAVESKGYDVITGSSFEGEKLLQYMRQQLKAELA